MFQVRSDLECSRKMNPPSRQFTRPQQCFLIGKIKGFEVRMVHPPFRQIWLHLTSIYSHIQRQLLENDLDKTERLQQLWMEIFRTLQG